MNRMRIVNLIEDTSGSDKCLYAHGLSFYIETGKHRLLMDLGPGAETLDNAASMGINLKQVDLVVLSHGHYDHSGGILPFSGLNGRAPVYMQKSAGGDFYADDGEQAGAERYRYIGIDKAVTELPQIRIIEGDHVIDDETEIFTIGSRTHRLPSANRRLLVKRNGELVNDDFGHEQFLVLKENGKYVLLSGCAHNGILSILDAFREKYVRLPDAVISGFHLMKMRR